MSITVAELVATLGLEDKTFRRGLDQIGGLLASGAIIAGLNKVEAAASDLQQAAGGTAAVFGDMAGIIDRAAKDSAQSMGLSERQFREATSRIGALLKGMGYDTREAAEESIRLTQVGADLAATFGGTTAEAVDALAAALRGETDPIERYGISLRQADIDARAMAMGLWDGTGAIDANAKAQAALAIITEKSGGALGQFAREADSAAGQAQIAAAETENAQANMGQALLPIYAEMSHAVAELASFFTELPGPARTAILAIAGIAAIAGPVNSAVSTVKSLTKAIESAAESGSGLASGLTRMGPALAAAGVAAAGAAISLAVWERAVQSARDTASDGADDIRQSFISSVDTADRFMESLDMIAATQRDLADASEQAWNPATQENMGRAADASTEVYNGFARLIPVINELASQTGDADEATRMVLASFDAVTQALNENMTPAEAAATVVLDQQAEAAARASAVTQAFGDDSADAAEAQRDLADAVNKAVAAARAALDPLFGMLDAIQRNREATADLDAAIAANSDTIDDNNVSADEMARLQQAAADSALDLNAAALQLAVGIQNGTVSLSNAEAQLESWVAQGLISQDTADGMRVQFAGAADQADRLAGDRTLTFRADIRDAVLAIQELQRQAAGVGENSYVVDVHARTGGPRAAGGRVGAGVAHPVGELGPEWFVPDTAGTIVNAQQVRDAGGGSSTLSDPHARQRARLLARQSAAVLVVDGRVLAQAERDHNRSLAGAR